MGKYLFVKYFYFRNIFNNFDFESSEVIAQCLFGRNSPGFVPRCCPSGQRSQSQCFPPPTGSFQMVPAVLKPHLVEQLWFWPVPLIKFGVKIMLRLNSYFCFTQTKQFV